MSLPLISWLVLMIIFWFFVTKVFVWNVFVQWKLRFEVPLLFLQQPNVYFLISAFIFLGMIVLPLMSEQLSLWLIAVAVLQFFVVGIRSCKLALNHYREFLMDILAEESDQKMIEHYKEQLALSDSDLWNNVSSTRGY